MELHQLQALRLQIEDILHCTLRGYAIRVVVAYPDSPNPLCFFEIDGPVFAQGSFWANNEFCIEAMHTGTVQELMNVRGEFQSCSQVLGYVRDLCGHINL